MLNEYKRYKANSSSEVVFVKTTTKTTVHLRTDSSLMRGTSFMQLLSSEFQASNIATDQASEHADRLIVATTFDELITVEQNIDLLVLLTGTKPAVNNMYLKTRERKTSRCNLLQFLQQV